MPPRRRRGGIQPWQDAQLKEAEDLLNSLTGAADMTTAEIQRTLRAPRLDALPPRAITRRRNVPELGGIDALRLAAGEPANIRFEWRQGALTVVGFVDAASANFTLRPSSAAFKLGIAPLNVSDAGPRSMGGGRRPTCTRSW